jgi:hypothetical protein
MINYLKAILLALFTFGLFYLFGAFYSASFFINQWTDGARFIVSFMGGLCSVIVIVASIINDLVNGGDK